MGQRSISLLVSLLGVSLSCLTNSLAARVWVKIRTRDIAKPEENGYGRRDYLRARLERYEFFFLHQ